MTDSFAIVAMIAVVTTALVFLAAPIAITVVLSFDARTYLGTFPPRSFSLHWYDQLVHDDYIIEGMKTSLVLGVVASLLATIAGVGAGVALHFDESRWRGVLLGAFLSPLVVPAVVIGFAILFTTEMVGIVDGFVRLLLGHLVITIPYTIRATLASLVGVRRSLYESALVLGAGEIRALVGVIAPQARSGMVAGFVIALSVSFDDVAMSIFLSNPSSYTISVALAGIMKGNFNLVVAAASVVLLIGTLLMLVISDRIFGLERLLGWRGRNGRT